MNVRESVTSCANSCTLLDCMSCGSDHSMCGSLVIPVECSEPRQSLLLISQIILVLYDVSARRPSSGPFFNKD